MPALPDAEREAWDRWREHGSANTFALDVWLPEHSVLVFWGCRTKLPQTGWFKTTEIQADGSGGQKPKIRVSAGLVPSESMGGGSVSVWCSREEKE